MPSNKRAAYRYRLIDQALQRRHKKWTFEDLLTFVNEQLCENFGAGSGIGKRTLEADFQTMRAEPPLGYNAPISYQKGIVRYSDPHFSIEQMPVSADDIRQLTDALELLRQFPELDIHNPLDQIIQKVRQRIFPIVVPQMQQPIVYFEKNPLLKGLPFLQELYQYTRDRMPIKVWYKPFDMDELTFVFHPYLIREYNNRWFIIGWHSSENKIWNLSLDRITRFENTLDTFIPNTFFNPESYFENVIGISVPENMPLKDVRISISPSLAPYIVTKPLHPSQEVISSNQKETIISLRIIPNFEFYALVLSHTPNIFVLSPVEIRSKMKSLLQEGLKSYNIAIFPEA